ncbi:protein tyrosine phosphatase type IVA 2-like isoform X2 [Nelusetta ayraudi]|uniref:protein tyrosine phosphatase type IVA 2-like isoform X2 n=1 Tax=Nelusetta ayraudi TaxID=303726 RepID=UPI003F709D09
MNRRVPVEITYDCMRFLLTHNPASTQMEGFIEDLKEHGAKTLVRVCAPTYDKAPLEQEGIQVLLKLPSISSGGCAKESKSLRQDWSFEDGSGPPEQVVEDWLHLLQAKFRDEAGSCVAVHCTSGLGRGPVLVALALIECGMECEDAVHFIRQKRHGAFNSKQLQYLESYKPKMCLRVKDANGQSCCTQ